ncbi:MAG: endo alpha-1,4 polygalactosaminidase, partial [Elusimicrobiota bacterium]
PPRRWIAFYGTTLSLKAWKTLDLAVLDPDAFELPAAAPSASGGTSRSEDGGPLRLAYVSAGEADEKRSYWPQAEGKPYLVEANPDWPEAHRVDMRSDAWRRLLLDEVVPKALAKGYDGVFLDTLDTAQYLQSKDTAAYAGSMDAAKGLVEALRAQYPDKLILLNNALPLIEGLADAADGVVVEDLYTRCDPQAKACVPTPPEVSAAKEATLLRWKERTGKPVFVLLYSGLRERDSRPLRKAVRRCLKNGFFPYLALPSLMSLGRVAPGSP